MALTNHQKEIIHLMKERNATVDEAQGVILLLENDSNQKAMVTYLRTNPKVSPIEIVEKAVEIRDLK